MGADALVQHSRGRVEAHVVHPVSHVESEPGSVRLADFRVDAAVPVKQPAGVGSEEVSQDVTRPKQPDHVLDRDLRVGVRVGIADVHQQREPHLVRERARPTERLDAQLAHGRPRNAGLDADDHVAVRLDDARRRVLVDRAGSGELAEGWSPRGAHQCQVQEDQHARPGAGDDEAGEPFERRGTRGARIDHGGHAGADAEQVRVDAVEPDPLVDMHVAVDEPGGDERPVELAHCRPSGLHLAADGGDLAVLDPQFEAPVDAAPRIHHPPAFEHQRHRSPPAKFNELSCIIYINPK